MLPTKKFSELPIVTSVSNDTKVFCIVSGVDSMVTLAVLKDFFGVISSGGGGSSGDISGSSTINIASSYSNLLTLEVGSEYLVEPYIYKRVGTGVLRVNPDTEFSTPMGTGISGGLVLPTYAQLLTADNGFEYHELPYVYKKYSSGVYRVNCDTDFAIPTGIGVTTGIVFNTYSGLLASSMYGYEYHESPYIYKRSISGAVRINCDTDFVTPS